jgi:hypothetical protein
MTATALNVENLLKFGSIDQRRRPRDPPNRVLSGEVRKAGKPVEAKVIPPSALTPGRSQFLCASRGDLGSRHSLGPISEHTVGSGSLSNVWNATKLR